MNVMKNDELKEKILKQKYMNLEAYNEQRKNLILIVITDKKIMR